MVKNPPANAGDMGSSTGPGKFPRAAEQLNPCATTTEPVLYSPRATTTEARAPRARAVQRSHRSEKSVHRNEEQPTLAATRESPRAATKTQRSQNK